MVFTNRFSAGEQLANDLQHYHFTDPYVLALPRGGVPIGFEIAKILNAPLNVLVARKLGAPTNPEFGIGSIAENGVIILDERTINLLQISQDDLHHVILHESSELERRIAEYRHGDQLPSMEGRTVILVDDGLATGVTARAAIESTKKLHPKELIFASPVCALDSVHELQNEVDQVICLAAPIDFIAVGRWYQSFSQVTDEEVVDLLHRVHW